MGEWKTTTARVLTHLRKLSRIGDPPPSSQVGMAAYAGSNQDKAAIDKVWASVGVRIDEYDDSSHWKNVAPERRKGVWQRLQQRDGFTDAAFLPRANLKILFGRPDLLKWGYRLLAEAWQFDYDDAILARAAPPAFPEPAAMRADPPAVPMRAPPAEPAAMRADPFAGMAGAAPAVSTRTALAAWPALDAWGNTWTAPPEQRPSAPAAPAAPPPVPVVPVRAAPRRPEPVARRRTSTRVARRDMVDEINQKRRSSGTRRPTAPAAPPVARRGDRRLSSLEAVSGCKVTLAPDQANANAAQDLSGDTPTAHALEEAVAPELPRAPAPVPAPAPAPATAPPRRRSICFRWLDCFRWRRRSDTP